MISGETSGFHLLMSVKCCVVLNGRKTKNLNISKSSKQNVADVVAKLLFACHLFLCRSSVAKAVI